MSAEKAESTEKAESDGTAELARAEKERDSGGRDGVLDVVLELPEEEEWVKEESASGASAGVDKGVVLDDDDDDIERGIGGRARAPPMAGTRLGCLSSGLCINKRSVHLICTENAGTPRSLMPPHGRCAMGVTTSRGTGAREVKGAKNQKKKNKVVLLKRQVFVK